MESSKSFLAHGSVLLCLCCFGGACAAQAPFAPNVRPSPVLIEEEVIGLAPGVAGNNFIGGGGFNPFAFNAFNPFNPSVYNGASPFNPFGFNNSNGFLGIPYTYNPNLNGNNSYYNSYYLSNPGGYITYGPNGQPYLVLQYGPPAFVGGYRPGNTAPPLVGGYRPVYTPPPLVGGYRPPYTPPPLVGGYRPPVVQTPPVSGFKPTLRTLEAPSNAQTQSNVHTAVSAPVSVTRDYSEPLAGPRR